MGGHQLYDVLLRQGKRVPFLFTSGYSVTESSDGGILNSTVPVLHKPWTLNDLFARVREVLDQGGTTHIAPGP
jgi:response regulator RpfG family c-di-GMP phosphodiesterase